MKIISHRGYLEGTNDSLENNPSNIDKCIKLGLDVEIDLRVESNNFYLGHDYKKYEINIEWLERRKKYLWVHCKDQYSLEYLNTRKVDLNYFWHETDTFTLTSKNFIWAFPSKQIYKFAINVLPELNFKVSDFEKIKVLGVCTDFPKSYSKV